MDGWHDEDKVREGCTARRLVGEHTVVCGTLASPPTGRGAAMHSSSVAMAGHRAAHRRRKPIATKKAQDYEHTQHRLDERPRGPALSRRDPMISSPAWVE